MKIAFILLLLFCFASPCRSQDKNPLFPIDVNDKTGYIDGLGKIVIEPQFQAGSEFHDGPARIEVGDKWGFIDKTGRIVIEPSFIWAEDFSEGLALVQVFGTRFSEPRS
ncbi:MAG: WG repeat-containing protein, partial [Pyrinomonadaceae bacterium]